MAEQKPISEYLSELEQVKLLSFVSDKVMMEAVRKVLLAGVYYNGTLRPDFKADPTKNFALGIAFDTHRSDAELGTDLRATAYGISFIEQGFNEIVKMTNQPMKTELPKENPAE